MSRRSKKRSSRRSGPRAVPAEKALLPVPPAPPPRDIRRLTAASALLLSSGFCALLYEVVWARMLVTVLGNTTLTVATVLAVFMAGLAMGGAFWGGRVERRPDRALATFCLLEAAVGVYAFCFPFLLDLVMHLQARFSDPESNQTLLRFFLAGGILFWPTFFMGGTLAAGGQYAIQDQERFGRDTALLYGMNTLGAVLGTFLTGFVLIQALGHKGALNLGGTVNLATGAAAFFLYRWTRPKVLPGPSPQAGPPGSKPWGSPAAAAALVAALSGFCALAYEIVWTRLLVLVMDNSIYSFSAILTTILLGLALGGFGLANLLVRYVRPILALAAVEVALGISALGVPFFIQPNRIEPDRVYGAFLFSNMPKYLLVPAILMGAAFPLAAAVYQKQRGGVGKSLGWMAAFNTLGAVLGALTAGYVLIPALGFFRTCLILTGVNLTAGLAAWLAGTQRVWRWAGAAALVGIMGLAIHVYPSDLFQKMHARLEPGSKLIYYDEGRAATVSVFRRPDHERMLYLNGIAELDSSMLSLQTFRLMGALPALIHPDPQNSLMVTFGAGITSGANAPFVKHVDAVDLVGQYRDIAGLFESENRQIVDSPKFHMHVDDARHFLLVTPRRFDIIISDATHPRSYDSWVLFTREFYALVKSRLNPGGIFCQWLPYHGLAPDQYLSILATFIKEFPHTSAWSVGGAYSLLVATPETLAIDYNEMTRKMANPVVDRMMGEAGLRHPISMLAKFRAGEKALADLAAQARGILTDNSPGHLFFPYDSTFKEQYEIWPEINFKRLNQARRPIAPFLKNVGRDPKEKERILYVLEQKQR